VKEPFVDGKSRLEAELSAGVSPAV